MLMIINFQKTIMIAVILRSLVLFAILASSCAIVRFKLQKKGFRFNFFIM